MSGNRVNPIRALLLLLACWVMPLAAGPAHAQAVTPDRPAEYMIYQYPGAILVLKFDVPEALFNARTIGPENALIKASGVPGRRIGPVFQYIDAVNRPRQLMIEITPDRPIDRSAISLEILQFGADDRNSATLVRGYQLLSTGAEAEYGNSASTWGMKAYSMRNAGDFFVHLGMQEMSLWSEYFAAHLMLHRLNDPLMALELLETVLQGSQPANYQEVELAARILEGDSLLRLAAMARGQSDRPLLDRAHGALAHVARLAEAQELPATHGRSLYFDGRAYEMAGEPERALERYQQALEITQVSGDDELLNEIRAASAEAYQLVGRTSGAIEMLDDIAGDLAELPQENADLELAIRLLEKGRLLSANYRFAEAIPELARALELQKSQGDSRIWAPTSLELAWAYHSVGDADNALQLLDAALRLPDSQLSTNLLGRAYGSLAQIHRERGEFSAAARAREQQALRLSGDDQRAAFLVESALDVRVQEGAGAAGAEALMREARQAARASGAGLTEHRANLYLCLLQIESRGGTACEQGDSARSFDALRSAGVPWLAADANMVQARILRLLGRLPEARAVMDRLIDDVYWFRRALPGVLGAWYASNRDELGQEFVSLARPANAVGSAGYGDGRSLLLAMERLRMLEQADFTRPAGWLLDAETQEPLRSLLARREAENGAAGARLAAEVNRQIAAARGADGADSGAISVTQLEQLLAQLGPAEAVLAYHLDGAQSQSVVARRDGVKAFSLPSAARIEAQLGQARDLLPEPSPPGLADLLGELGEVLLEPVAAELPAIVYLLPTGPLRAVPLDALIMNGRFFAEDRRLVNIGSLLSIDRRAPKMSSGFRDRVFVAGNPQARSDPFSLDLRVSPEIAAVTDQFVGPGLHIVQGLALGMSEFEDDRFAGAALAHLALAGTVDLAFPPRSRLLLASASDDRGGAGAYLSPSDVRAFSLAADLVVMSGTIVTGESRSPADGRLAFVADLHAAGVQTVVASLWPAGETANARFATELYSRLQGQAGIAEALLAAKRSRMGSDALTNLPAWAGFQLFIR
jgi:CHAT domain-containing protein/tetratricopeptide (TPR) repeat protein